MMYDILMVFTAIVITLRVLALLWPARFSVVPWQVAAFTSGAMIAWVLLGIFTPGVPLALVVLAGVCAALTGQESWTGYRKDRSAR